MILKIFLLIVFHFVFFLSIDFLTFWLGFALFYLGVKNIGHYLVSASLASIHFLRSVWSTPFNWILDNCPFPDDSVSKCRRWTCPHYSECEKRRK